MKRWLIAILILTTTVSAEDKKVSTGDPKSDALMVEIQKKVRKIDACVAKQTTLIRIMDQEVTLSSNAAFQRPNLMRLDTVQDDVIVSQRLSDGGLMWTYDREEKLATKANLGKIYRITNLEADADQADPLRPFRSLEWETIRYTGDETFEEMPHYIFEATPKTNLLHAQLPQPPVKVKLVVRPKDGLLRIVRFLDASDNEIITQTFHNLTINPKLEAKWFEFIIPSGAHIIDSTNDIIQALKGAGSKQ
jgi:outer membrane lipoprotein-sorting protein